MNNDLKKSESFNFVMPLLPPKFSQQSSFDQNMSRISSNEGKSKLPSNTKSTQGMAFVSQVDQLGSM
jgi:hypothetical protein